MYNMLYVNNGNGFFSEIVQFFGIGVIDWSWFILLVDFDNDGRKDIYIFNGFMWDICDNDVVRLF